ncbi:FAD:protein FMN transferase [bacterium]|nr:MAG: FAD:protein FMN transferase [bacterium]
MRNKKFSLFLILFVLFIWLFVFFVIPSKNLISITGSTMGTTYEVKISDRASQSIDLISKDIDSILNLINQSMSTYIENSEISVINNDTLQNKVFKITEDFEYVLNKSLDYYILTEGAFDVTVRPLLKLWGFKGEVIYRVPEPDLIKQTLKYIGSDNIIVKSNRFSKKNPKLQLDFGAIAKGYAVDKISSYLIDSGFKIHYVEIGGEVVCKGKDWNIQIAYPEFLSEKGFKVITLNNKAVATSGTYNQTIEIEDQEYSHIFDSRVGMPVKNNIVSVTVISDKCIDTDALSTSLKVIGKEDGLKLVNSLKQTECMFILKESGVLKDYYSNGFSNFLLD